MSPVSQPLTLPNQLWSMRHPALQGIPDLVVEGDGYTMDFMGPTLLSLDIIDTDQAQASCEPGRLKSMGGTSP
jgi:hypothetical protein